MTLEERHRKFEEYLHANPEERRKFDMSFLEEPLESEDERIRKEIVFIVKQYGRICEKEGDPCCTINDCLAYLEKQKEQPKPAEKQDYSGLTDEDELMRTAVIRTLERFGGRGTTGMQINWLKSLRPQSREGIYQLAKHDIAIRFMNYLDENRPEGKMCLSNGECEDIEEAFKKNDWAKIVRYVNKFLPQPQQGWSEKDEEMRNLIIAIFEVNHPDGFFKANELGTTDMRGIHTEEIISWLKSLPLNLKKRNEDVAKLCSNEWSEEDENVIETLIRELRLNAQFEVAVRKLGLDYIQTLTVLDKCRRLCPQPKQEWSEEDENKLNHILEIVHIASGSEASVDEKEELEDFLKSLRPSWKPSEEQMGALQRAVNKLAKTDVADSVRLSILSDNLKKLK